MEEMVRSLCSDRIRIESDFPVRIVLDSSDRTSSCGHEFYSALPADAGVPINIRESGDLSVISLRLPKRVFLKSLLSDWKRFYSRMNFWEIQLNLCRPLQVFEVAGCSGYLQLEGGEVRSLLARFGKGVAKISPRSRVSEMLLQAGQCDADITLVSGTDRVEVQTAFGKVRITASPDLDFQVRKNGAVLVGPDRIPRVTDESSRRALVEIHGVKVDVEIQNLREIPA